MSNINQLELSLDIKQNSDLSYSFQYNVKMSNGAFVKLEGINLSEESIITISLSHKSLYQFEIQECLIPCGQQTLTGKVTEKSGEKQVILHDLDNDKKPTDYNFIIIAINKASGEQVVCDPQIRNVKTD